MRHSYLLPLECVYQRSCCLYQELVRQMRSLTRSQPSLFFPCQYCIMKNWRYFQTVLTLEIRLLICNVKFWSVVEHDASEFGVWIWSLFRIAIFNLAQIHPRRTSSCSLHMQCISITNCFLCSRVGISSQTSKSLFSASLIFTQSLFIAGYT